MFFRIFAYDLSNHFQRNRHMRKQKLSLQYELRSNSANIIWQLISNEAGLQKWLADSVVRDGDSMTFTWGEVWSHHDTHTAAIIEEKKLQHIRFRWADDEDPDTYWQMGLEKSDITNDYILCVTDFALPEDIDSLRDIWDSNLERLHRSTGL